MKVGDRVVFNVPGTAGFYQAYVDQWSHVLERLKVRGYKLPADSNGLLIVDKAWLHDVTAHCCNVHGMVLSRTKGYYWSNSGKVFLHACPKKGCTVARWEQYGSLSTPADEDTREARKLLHEAMQSAGPAKASPVLKYAEGLTYGIGIGKLNIQECETCQKALKGGVILENGKVAVRLKESDLIEAGDEYLEKAGGQWKPVQPGCYGMTVGSVAGKVPVRRFVDKPAPAPLYRILDRHEVMIKNDEVSLKSIKKAYEDDNIWTQVDDYWSGQRVEAMVARLKKDWPDVDPLVRRAIPVPVSAPLNLSPAQTTYTRHLVMTDTIRSTDEVEVYPGSWAAIDASWNGELVEYYWESMGSQIPVRRTELISGSNGIQLQAGAAYSTMRQQHAKAIAQQMGIPAHIAKLEPKIPKKIRIIELDD